MLTAVIISEPQLRDAIVSFVSGVKQTHQHDNVIFYQKNDMIFVFSENLSLREVFDLTLAEYQPEKIFITETGRSVDVDHEIGDIILPNVFLSFNPQILTTEITNDNRDALIGDARFLEIFDEQKDYFVEDYGLSIGGIVVEGTPVNEQISDKLMTVYEADVYTEKTVSPIVALMEENLVPTLCLVGVTAGKLHHRDALANPYKLVAENMMTTIRLLADEEV